MKVGPLFEISARRHRKVYSERAGKSIKGAEGEGITPALYVMALWLKSLNGSDDVLIPMPPAHDSLTSGRLYSETELVEALRGPAQGQPTFDDSPEGSTG